MGRRSQIPGYKLIDAGDMSGNVTQSPNSTIDQFDKIALLCEWTGTAPVGEIQVDVRYKYKDSGLFSGYHTLNLGSVMSVSGNSGEFLISIDNSKFEEMRVRYVRTSGTGSLTVTMNAHAAGG